MSNDTSGCAAGMDNFDAVTHVVPAYPDGDVVGPCVCGSWPGGKCLRCPTLEAAAWAAYSRAWPEAMAGYRPVARSPWQAQPAWTPHQMVNAGLWSGALR